MRLVRLQDELHHHAIEHIVARDGSGAGTLLHWSHLLDLLLIVLAAPFRLVMDTHAALHAAAVVFGPLSMAGLGAALCWAIALVAKRRWLWLGAAAVALSPGIASYGMSGEAHHHVPMLAVIAMVAGYALRGALGLVRKGDGVAMGALAAIGIWLTPEAMPFTLMAFGGLWLAWLQQPHAGLSRMIAETAAAFGLAILAAFAVDPPSTGYGSIQHRGRPLHGRWHDDIIQGRRHLQHWQIHLELQWRLLQHLPHWQHADVCWPEHLRIYKWSLRQRR
jgi:hypothetical protein